MAVGYPHSKLVARLRAIAGLGADDAARIERLPIKLQNFGPNHDIVRDGDTLDQCCMLVDGFLIRHKQCAEGQRQIVSCHVPGDIPDLYSLHLNPIDHKSRHWALWSSASFRTRRCTRLCRAPQA